MKILLSAVLLITGFLLSGFQPAKLGETIIDCSFDKLSQEPVSSVIKSYTLIPLEANENSYLSRIEKVQMQMKKYGFWSPGNKKIWYVFYQSSGSMTPKVLLG